MLLKGTERRHACNASSGVVLGRLGRRAGGRCVALGHTTVDDKVCAVDETALVAGQEENCLRLLNGFAKATAGEVDFAAVALLGVITEPVLEKGSAGEVSLVVVEDRDKLTSTAQGTAN